MELVLLFITLRYTISEQLLFFCARGRYFLLHFFFMRTTAAAAAATAAAAYVDSHFIHSGRGGNSGIYFGCGYTSTSFANLLTVPSIST